jgi:hypothetical protein
LTEDRKCRAWKNYLSSQFLKKIHRTLREKLASKFLFELQENCESYHLIKGKVYIDCIINLLRCSYKSLEIELEETLKPAALSNVKPAPWSLTATLVRPAVMARLKEDVRGK